MAILSFAMWLLIIWQVSESFSFFCHWTISLKLSLKIFLPLSTEWLFWAKSKFKHLLYQTQFQFLSQQIQLNRFFLKLSLKLFLPFSLPNGYFEQKFNSKHLFYQTQFQFLSDQIQFQVPIIPNPVRNVYFDQKVWIFTWFGRWVFDEDLWPVGQLLLLQTLDFMLQGLLVTHMVFVLQRKKIASRWTTLAYACRFPLPLISN